MKSVDDQQQQQQQQMMVALTIFTSDTSNDRTITVGNWTFECNGPTQLRIHNMEGEQVSLLARWTFDVRYQCFRWPFSSKANRVSSLNPIGALVTPITLRCHWVMNSRSRGQASKHWHRLSRRLPRPCHHRTPMMPHQRIQLPSRPRRHPRRINKNWWNIERPKWHCSSIMNIWKI